MCKSNAFASECFIPLAAQPADSKTRVNSTSPPHQREIAPTYGHDFQDGYALNIDWLTVRFGLCELDPADWLEEFPDGSATRGGYTVAIVDQGTKLYTHTGYIMRDGQHLARFALGARQVIHQGTAALTLENSVLYDATYQRQGIGSLAVELGEVLDCKQPRIQRIDLALDGVDLLTPINDFAAGNIQKVGKVKLLDANGDWRPTYSHKRNRVEGFSMGSRHSGRFFRYYNKSHELAVSKKDKGYIHEYFVANGVHEDAESKCVFRAEFELTTRFLRSYAQDLQVTDLDDFKHWEWLYTTAADQGQFMHFAPPKDDTNVSRWASFSLLHGIELSRGIFWNTKREVTDGIRATKVAVKRLFLEAAAAADEAAEFILRDAAATLARQHQLCTWLRSRFDFWLPDIRRRAVTSAACSLRTVSPSQWDPLNPMS